MFTAIVHNMREGNARKKTVCRREYLVLKSKVSEQERRKDAQNGPMRIFSALKCGKGLKKGLMKKEQ
jgi:hypothetical protein